MIKYLEAYCDINNIPDSKTRIQGGQYIVQKPQTMLYIKHRYAPILQAFQKLLNDQRSVERFMTYGDSGSSDPFLQNKNYSTLYDAITLIQEEKNIAENSLLMLAEESIHYAEHKHKKKRDETVKSLGQKKCLLLRIQRV